jgi:ABC-type multidrug transport system ATPase subunit
MVEKPNVLVLDEPTNHLDMESIEALIEALVKYEEEGTLLFVSHDRAFVSALATRILEVTPNGFRDFPGTYEEYLERCGDDHLDADTVVLKAKKEKVASAETGGGAPAKTETALSWEEQKKRANRIKQLPVKRDEVLAAIEAAEARKAAIQAKWCEAGFYEKTPKAEVAKLEEEEKALGPKIDALLAEWETIEAELAAATTAGGA